MQLVESKVSVMTISGKAVTAEQSKKARAMGWESTQNTQTGGFTLTKAVNFSQPENDQEAVELINQINSTREEKDRTSLSVLVAQYARKCEANKETAAINNALSGKDTPNIKNLRQTLGLFGIDLDKLDAEIAASATPDDRYSEEFWMKAVKKALGK